MNVRNQRYDALVIHPLWALVGAVVAGYGVLHILWKRRMRRRQSEFDIPEFFSGRTDSSNDAGRGFKGDWTEVRRRPCRTKN